MGSAEELKAEGNKLFGEGDYLKAAAAYTKAIKLDPKNAVLFSNRSASLLKLKKVSKALEDAEECVKLRPDWEKGYFRKAAVYEEQQQWSQALATYHAAEPFCPKGSTSHSELTQKLRTLTKLVKNAEVKANEDTIENFIEKSVGTGPVADFANEIMQLVAEHISQDGHEFVPSLHWKPGQKTTSTETSEQHVRATLAFTQPDYLSKFVEEMRMLGERLDAEAVCIIAPKAAISFPQVWQKSGWPCGKNSGVFVQLEARGGVQRCWFVPVYDKLPGKPHSLPEEFSPVQAKLLK